MNPRVTTLFVSAVGNEFASYRTMFDERFRVPQAVDVTVQEKLVIFSKGTLAELDVYIRDCHVVLHFVGDQTGQAPPAERNEVPALLKRYNASLPDRLNLPDQLIKWQLDDAAVAMLTRTQWEALLAVYHGKELVIARPAPTVLPDKPITDKVEAAKQRDRQREHLERLQRIYNKGTLDFDSYESLAIQLYQKLIFILAHSEGSTSQRGADPVVLGHMYALRDSVLDNPNAAPPKAIDLEAIHRHPPTTLEEYYLHQIAHWSLGVHQINTKFTPLALRLNVDGESVDRDHKDLREVLRLLESKKQRALTVLGPPGAGKTTLLRRLGYDVAIDALRSGREDARVPFYAELRRFKRTDDRTSPRTWLAREWQERRYGNFGDFEQMMNSGRLLILLDAINEMPCAASEYDDLLGEWSDFIAPESLPVGNQVVFSCRRLDYSRDLMIGNETIPHVEVESLDPGKIKDFLDLYLEGPSDLVETTYAKLEAGRTLFEIYNLPFYLTLLVDLVRRNRAVPSGRAGLFSAFIREGVKREILTNELFLRNGPLLTSAGYDQARSGQWSSDHDLPFDQGLFAGLATLAYNMQVQDGAKSLARRSALLMDIEAAGALLASDTRGTSSSDQLFDGAYSLHLLDKHLGDVQFRHQLFQEYFAARKLAYDISKVSVAEREALAVSFAQLARQPWQVSEIRPTVKQELARLGLAERLPMLELTGWEETFKLAVAMLEQPDVMVGALADTNLALAGLAAAQPEVKIGARLRDELRQRLLERSIDLAADLRARIAAGLALGELGDPRLTPGPLPESGLEAARALLPEFVEIRAGKYPVGVKITEIPAKEQRYYRDAAPAWVTIAKTFEIARFPVTNAEWRRFMHAKGYTDERWWRSTEARKWRDGKATGEAARRNWRRVWDMARTEPESFAELRRQYPDSENSFREITDRVGLDESEFDDYLRNIFPDKILAEPALWRNPAFNSPAQPVVGVCWHEAMAYCAWLEAECARGGAKFRFRLPTETEWEVAARGKGAWMYPWGNTWDAERCNTQATRLKGTTPVGVFPHGNTPRPHDVSDLAGNVWEWTSTEYRPSIVDMNDGREDLNRELDDSGKPLARVVRGASWLNFAVYARAAYRGYRVPGSRRYHQGFRVVRVSHP